MAPTQRLIAVCLLAALIGADQLQPGRAHAAGALARPKRDSDKQEAPAQASAQASSIVSASVQHGREPDADESKEVASGANANAGADTSNQVDSSSAASPKRAQAASRTAPLDDQDDARPAGRPKKRRPVINRRPPPPPPRYDEGDEYEDEACYDDYPDYGMMVHANAARNHFRHMNRMMGGMFNQMRSLAAGDYDNLPVGPNAAVASTFGGGGGGGGGDSYSRGFSVVTNNGRTRGFVTETRNGRTRTRRIGDADDDE